MLFYCVKICFLRNISDGEEPAGLHSFGAEQVFAIWIKTVFREIYSSFCVGESLMQLKRLLTARSVQF